MRSQILQAMLCTLVFTMMPAVAFCRDYHVSVASGSDQNVGSESAPLKTIQAAAERAYPGDRVIVHSGVYREWVHPVRSGTELQPIVFQAAQGEKVEIKGSEVIKGWRHVDRNTWMVKLPNTFFHSFNPYTDTIHGDWLERGGWSHTGEVYLNGNPLNEVANLDSLFLGGCCQPLWFAKADKDTTFIWANFSGHDPNAGMVEINVRQTVFYPEQPFINYIHVKGFHLSQAATPWAPPTAEQPGLIGTHWSKGWVIEDNVISYSKCVGITLGKYGDEWDNKAESVEGFIGTAQRALQKQWNRSNVGSHIVRRNIISNCGQAGIAGSLGAIFSIVADNEIHDIGLEQPFWGYEIAGIKFHAPVDMLISHNHIYRTEGGIWLDWMAQGTRITRNLLHDNRLQDLSLEVNHGPILVDNNLFLSPELAQIKLSQGVRFVHNTIAWKIWPTGERDDRKTPYLTPHGTDIAGYHDCPCGDASYYNNLFLRADMTPYDQCILPVTMSGNLYLQEAKPSLHEQDAQKDSTATGSWRVVQEGDGWYLETLAKPEWKQPRAVVRLADLGTAMIPNQTFESDGIPDKFNEDYLGNKRKGKKLYPGAIEFEKVGKQKVKVF